MRRATFADIDRDIGFGIILAIQILVIFVVSPLAAAGAIPAQLVEGLRFGLAAVTIAIVARRLAVRWAVAVAFVATLVAGIHWQAGGAAGAIGIVRALATLAFDLIVASIVAAATFRSGRVNIPRILGAIILYLYVALIFAGLYRLIAPTLHPAFAGIGPDPRAQFSGMLYFSLGALTTAGSDEIVALHPLLRSLSRLESVIGQLYPATLLARLVSLHVAAHGRED